MPTWPKPNELTKFYGDPDAGGDGIADRVWELENLVRFAPPYDMYLAWAPHKKLNSITCHKKCASSLLKILENIRDHYGSQEAIEKVRMHMFGGAYNFRLTRGATRLSTHAYGAAIDLDPEANRMGRPYKESLGMIPMAVVNMFKSEGWVWGGDFKRPDCMHMQAVQ